MSKHIILPIVALCMLLISCSDATKKSDKNTITVSLPVQEFFIKALADTAVNVNVMIPVTAGHSTYTPLPSQLRELSNSAMYLAIGTLDFEIAWKERLCSIRSGLQWERTDEGIEACYGTHSHGEETEHDHNGHKELETMDPHYWLSPIQAKKMVENTANAITQHCGLTEGELAERVNTVNQKLDEFDIQLKQCNAKAFMIYHPALTYIARDYGMAQLTIEQEGKSISPREYAEQIEKAKQLGVKVIFCQQGYDTDRVRGAANDIGAEIVEIQPESGDYMHQMSTIISALRKK